jgi:hypothetical protein
LEVKKKLSDALDICRLDIAEYTLVWASINNNEVERRAVVELEELFDTADIDLAKQEPRQPIVIGGIADTHSAAYLDELIQALDAVGTRIFADTGEAAVRSVVTLPQLRIQL